MVCTHHTPYSIHTLTYLESSCDICSQSCIMYDFGAIRMQTIIAFGTASQSLSLCILTTLSENWGSTPALLSLDYCLVVSTEVDDIVNTR